MGAVCTAGIALAVGIGAVIVGCQFAVSSLAFFANGLLLTGSNATGMLAFFRFIRLRVAANDTLTLCILCMGTDSAANCAYTVFIAVGCQFTIGSSADCANCLCFAGSFATGMSSQPTISLIALFANSQVDTGCCTTGMLTFLRTLCHHRLCQITDSADSLCIVSTLAALSDSTGISLRCQCRHGHIG